jgi:hypothetical protein
LTYSDIETIFQTYLAANWTSTTVLAFDNVPQDVTQGIAWARFVIVPTDASNRTIGINPAITKNGIAVMQIFTALNKGSREAQNIADEFLSLMENQIHGDTLYTYAGETERIGDEGNNWYQLNVQVPFQGT